MFFLWVILANIIYIIMVVPVPATALIRPKITKMEIESNIRFRFATTTIRMQVNNTEKEAKMFYFEALLPHGALIFNVDLKVNGTLFEGHSRRKSREYSKWLSGSRKRVRNSIKNKTFFDTNIFLLNVTLAGQSEAFFNLTYKTLIVRKDGVYTHQIPIFLRQHLVVKNLHVLVNLWEPQHFQGFTSSLIKEENMPDIENDTISHTYPRTIWRSRNNIIVDYSEKLGKLRNIYSRIFQVQYDLSRSEDNQDVILWHNNEGLYFFSDDMNPSLPKDLVFTIDRSSSTKFEWLKQIQESFPMILDKLRPSDRFNIIMNNQNMSVWKNELQYANNENKDSAIQFIKSFDARGVADIALPLNKSLELLNDPKPERFQAVYFICDGYESVLKQSETIPEVLKIISGRNIPVFTAALGPIADVRVLRTIAAASGGKFKKIYESQVSEAAQIMVDFFGEINNYLLNNVTVDNCNEDARRFDRTRDYHNGTEIIFHIDSKCFSKNDKQEIVVTGRGRDGIKRYSFPVNNSDMGLHNDSQRDAFFRSYLEFLTIRTAIQLDDKKVLRNYESLVLTDRTFIAVRPKKEDYNNGVPGPTAGVSEIWTRDISAAGVGDPHFVVKLKGLKRPVCFDMMGRPGDVINLLYDKRNGILVNAKIICAKQEVNEDESENVDCERTYMGVISVMAPSENWTISPEGVQHSQHHEWEDELYGQLGNQFTAQYTDRRSMYMTWRPKGSSSAIKLLIRKSQTKKKKEEDRTKYLDFYLVDGSGLSNATDGLIGQFTDRRGVVFKVRKTADGKMKTDIRIHYKNRHRTFSAVLTGKRRTAQLRRDCWTVWKEGKGLVRGKYEDYVTEGLFELPTYKQKKNRKT